eukprot:1873366-Pleurochrysis_carterae.AAC.1
MDARLASADWGRVLHAAGGAESAWGAGPYSGRPTGLRGRSACCWRSTQRQGGHNKKKYVV